MVDDVDYELEALLSLDGYQFEFAAGYVVKYRARRVSSTKDRPQAVKYSLTLHDPQGRRIYGIDNAHRGGRRKEFDHRHIAGLRKVVAYKYRSPAVLLEDFLRQVERILKERDVL